MQQQACKERSAFTLIELLFVVMVVAVLLALILPSGRGVPAAARRTQCKNHLKLIGLALHNYHDVYGSFPPAYTVDANGNRLHSWRVLILPFIDQAPLFDNIDLTKPWDDPANAMAFEKQLSIYMCPSAEIDLQQTVYVALVGEGKAFLPTIGRPLDDFTDGTSQTILVAESLADQSIHWMSPYDDQLNVLNNFQADADSQHTGVIQVLFTDGAVRALSLEIDNEILKGLSTVDGGEDFGSVEY